MTVTGVYIVQRPIQVKVRGDNGKLCTLCGLGL